MSFLNHVAPRCAPIEVNTEVNNKDIALLGFLSNRPSVEMQRQWHQCCSRAACYGKTAWSACTAGTSRSQQAQQAQRLTEAPHVSCLGQRAVLHNLRRHVRDCGAVGEEGRETVLSMQTRSLYTVAL